eukprot:2597893-Ditylum_brightwellii.AAC.1
MEVELAEVMENADAFCHSRDTHAPESEGVGGPQCLKKTTGQVQRLHPEIIGTMFEEKMELQQIRSASLKRTKRVYFMKLYQRSRKRTDHEVAPRRELLRCKAVSGNTWSQLPNMILLLKQKTKQTKKQTKNRRRNRYNQCRQHNDKTKHSDTNNSRQLSHHSTRKH